MERIEFRLVVPEGKKSDAVDFLAGEHAEPVEQGSYTPSKEELDALSDAGFEPLTIVSCAFAATMLTPVLIKAVNTLRFPGGRIIRVHEGEVVQVVVPSADQGAVWLIIDDKVEYFDANRQNDALNRIGEVMGALGSSAGKA